jgi:hypothetical protein
MPNNMRNNNNNNNNNNNKFNNNNRDMNNDRGSFNNRDNVRNNNNNNNINNRDNNNRDNNNNNNNNNRINNNRDNNNRDMNIGSRTPEHQSDIAAESNQEHSVIKNNDVIMGGEGEKDNEKVEEINIEEEERKGEVSEGQRGKNVRHVLSKLDIFQSLAGNDLYDHITQIKRESCQVKEQANNKIIAERTLAAQVLKEATGGETTADTDEYSSLKTDLGTSGDLKGDKERAMNDEMDGDENMDFENGRLLDDYFYNLRRIQEIPNISEIIFTQFCNPMKVGPN